jgi:RHS repeat-associated protein
MRSVANATAKAARKLIVPLRHWSGKIRARSVPRALRRVTGDPVDVASGEVLMHQTDVALAGVLPLVLERTHVSSYRQGGLFGISWASTLDQRLEIDERGACFASADGMVLVYPPPTSTGMAVLPYEGPRWPLARTGEGYTITDPALGRTLHFQNPVPTERDQRLWPLTAISDRNGNRIDFVHTEDGTLSEVYHRGGYRVGVDIEGERVVALRLLRGPADGRPDDQVLIRYGYDDIGNLTEVINSSGQALRFGYDEEGRLTGWIDRNGEWYRYTYDDSGRCVSGTGSGGALGVSLSYADKTTVATDSLGNSTTYHFNELGQVVTQIDPMGHLTRSEWDRFDRLLSRTDQLGRTARYDYDEAGDLTTVTLPGGSATTIARDELGLPIRVTAPDGAVWRQHFDERGNLLAVTDPLDGTTRFTYDGHGHLTAVTDPLGNRTRVSTNSVGLPIDVTDPLGNVTRCERDALGRVTAATDAVGGITRFGWTVEGNLAWRTLPTGATERWRYDAEGNATEHVDASGRITRTEYTHFDLPAARIATDGTRLDFEYDTQLRLTSVRNQQGLVWRYSYDPAGRLVNEVDFDGRQLTYDYDAAGQVSARTDGTGHTTRLVRNTLGGVVEKHTGDGVTVFAYDVAGRLIRAANAAADVRLTRDALGRVVAETVNGRTLASTYDAAGRRVGRLTPVSAEATWEYDSGGRPAELATADRNIRFAYDPAGREIERSMSTDAGSGVAFLQHWDADHRVTAQTLRKASQTPIAGPEQSIQHWTYDYRSDGELIAVADRQFGPRNFTLDAIGRVTEVNGHDWIERYRYDPAGNLTEATWPTRPHDTQADGEREYARMLVRRAGGIRYEHDSRGRVVARRYRTLSGESREWRFTWNADDRLTSVVTPDGQRWRYSYDPFGRRTAKECLRPDGTVAGRIDFTWDRLSLAEQVSRDEAGLVSTTWDYRPGGIDAIVQTVRTSTRDAPPRWIDQRVYAIATDSAGAPVEMVDADGEVVWRFRATLWGNHVPAEKNRAYCPLRFPGQYHDPETGLNYNVHRYYDPVTARYQSPDPLGLISHANPYAYVHNPTRWTDPLGLSPYLVKMQRNRKPEMLAEEMSTTAPVIAEDSPLFHEIMAHIPRGETRHYRWAVDEDGVLKITVPGPDTSHAVITNGGPVRGAGMVEIGPGYNMNTGEPSTIVRQLTNETGHFLPPRSLAQQFIDVGTAAFERNGIQVVDWLRYPGI